MAEKKTSEWTPAVLLHPSRVDGKGKPVEYEPTSEAEEQLLTSAYGYRFRDEKAAKAAAERTGTVVPQAGVPGATTPATGGAAGS